MIERDYVVNLYTIYKDMLSEREKTYFEYYYYEDYSLTEIANIYKVSKAYVGKYLNKISNKLIKYESILNIDNKSKRIKEVIKDIHESDIKNKIEEIL